MNAHGESYGRVVLTTPANKGAAETPAESAEGRRPAKRNTKQSNLDRTLGRNRRRSRGLYGVREAARKDRSLKFTALLHHINPELLTASFYELKRKAAVGVDGVTWQEYEQDLENRIWDLHGRIHRGALRYFIGYSYGFRPRRSAHQAFDALYVAITEKRVNWVLDPDIEGFFDTINRDWLIKFIEHRVGDWPATRHHARLKAGTV